MPVSSELKESRMERVEDFSLHLPVVRPACRRRQSSPDEINLIIHQERSTQSSSTDADIAAGPVTFRSLRDELGNEDKVRENRVWRLN